MTSRRLTVLGCMSGTSADGIDVACADLALSGGDLLCAYRGCLSVPYEPALREQIVAAMPGRPDDEPPANRPPAATAADLCRLHVRLGEAYAAAFVTALGQLAGGRASLAVLHGQTVYHWVDDAGRARGSLQVGAAGVVAERLGLPVVFDLRGRDIAAGGQGAPLVPFFDQMLLAGRPGRCAAVNLGGIANITVVVGGRIDAAYDIGPAGALMDPAGARAADAAGDRSAFDVDGAAAARGRPSAPLLAGLMADPYYRRPWPRSTGREHFNEAYLLDRVARYGPGLHPDDVAATVTRLVAVLVADAARRHRVAEVVLSGGGTRNPTLLDWISRARPTVRVLTSAELGVPVQAKEALAFAVLGYLTWNGVPAATPRVTGARHPVLLGSIAPGAGPLLLPEPARPSPGPLALRLTGPRPLAEVR
ncbi:MAG: anhydro-N-acetylmuramic acid kinase [Streptosporangiaceae bacterium]